MKKILVITLLSLLLVSCGTKTKEAKIESQKEKNQEVMKQKFQDLTKYIKTDITDDETEKLLSILDDRTKKIAEQKVLIASATKENKDEVYKKIQKIRQDYINKITPYVSDLHMASFKKYFVKIDYSIKKKLDNLK